MEFPFAAFIKNNMGRILLGHMVLIIILWFIILFPAVSGTLAAVETLAVIGFIASLLVVAVPYLYDNMPIYPNVGNVAVVV